MEPNLGNRLLKGALYFTHCFLVWKSTFICSCKKLTENSMAPFTAPSELPLLLCLFEASRCRPWPLPPLMNCNEIQRRTMHLCFWCSLKATLPWCLSEPKIGTQWFVSGNGPPPCSACSQWHPCVPTHFWCCDKFPWHAVTSTLPRLRRRKERGVVVNPRFSREEWGKLSVLRVWTLALISNSPPPVFRWSGSSDPTLAKITTRWFWLGQSKFIKHVEGETCQKNLLRLPLLWGRQTLFGEVLNHPTEVPRQQYLQFFELSWELWYDYISAANRNHMTVCNAKHFFWQRCWRWGES